MRAKNYELRTYYRWPKDKKIKREKTALLEDSSITELKKVRINNINNVTIATLNINSLVSKFDELKVILQGIFNILIINETKLDASFRVNQFCINGFSTPYRLDRNRNGGEITIYVREAVTSKMLTKQKFSDDIEALFIEINFRKCKWLL